ncbi:MAG TPA: hypothetical protein VGE21_03915 [Flavobacteriales bacterium]
MKNLVRIAAFCCGSLLMNATFAQDKAATTGTGTAQTAKVRDNWRWMDLGAMQSGLGLNATEMGAMKEIENKYSKLRRELDASLTPEARQAELDKLMAARDKEAEETMTKDQRSKWAEIQAAKAKEKK